MTKSLRNAGLVVIGGLILQVLSTMALAIPLYTVGWDADLDLSVADRAETLELIRSRCVVYSDNNNGRNADVLIDSGLELAPKQAKARCT